MKIFVVCSRLGYGGAEHVAVMWANGFAERGHDITLISNLYEEITFKIDERIKVRNLISSVDSKTKKWCGAVKNVRKLAKENQPDVIISVMRVCSVIAKLAVIGMNIPVIATEHNAYEWPECHPMPFQARFFKFRLSKFYKAVTVLTEADKLVIGNRLKNAVVIPNPHILDPLNESTSRENVLLAVGRLDAWQVKGFDVLIKAFSKLVQGSRFKVQGSLKPSSEELIVNSEGWKLQIAGAGSEKSLNFLKGLCKENGVEDYVEFLGFQKDIEKLYQKASIFVLSSRYEGFGLVLIEAMSQGCACIACDYKGRQKEILRSLTPNPSPKGEGELPTEGSGAAEPETRNSKLETRNSETETRNSHVEVCETGILCEPDDVDALAEAMRMMITDDEYRESVRKNAVERSKYYSLDNIMGKWEDLLSKVVNM